MTPRVQGYSFVDAMPSPSPSEIGSDNVNSLMTLGTLASTPVALRNPNEDDPVFKAPAPPRPAERQDYGPFSKPSRRDELARQMASKASRSLAQRQSLQGKSSGLGLLRFGERSGTASPSSVSTTTSIRDPGATPGKDAYLSPAARTLLGRASGSSIRVESKSELRKRERQMDQDRERASQEKLKRQKWDASPLRNAS
jgi:protein DGCR14